MDKNNVGIEFATSHMSRTRAAGSFEIWFSGEETVVDKNKTQLRGLPRAAPPQIVLLLDAEARVLSLQARQTERGFGIVAESPDLPVHDVLHRGCGGGCEFEALWHDLWQRLASEDILEREIYDNYLNRVVRLSLVSAPGGRRHEPERRRQRAILTVNDITDCRRRSEALARERRLLQAEISLREQELEKFRTELAEEQELHGRDQELLDESRKRLRSLAQQLTQAQENERRRIALELHDGIAQRLGAIKFYMETISERLKGSENIREIDMLDESVKQIRDTADELRRISCNLSPPHLNDADIRDALCSLCDDFAMQYPDVELRCDIEIGDNEVPDVTKTAIYRIVQEALHNISKHANADQVTVSLKRDRSDILLSVADDGEGFSGDYTGGRASIEAGFGLRNMCERAEATTATFDVSSTPSAGTVISARWTYEVLQSLRGDEAVRDRVGGDSRDAV